jgi:uncharacterized protein (DUF58 family)
MVILDDREVTILKIGLAQLLLACLLVFALIRHQHHLTLLLLVLLAFVFGARVWSRFSLEGLEVRSSFDRDRIFPGEEVRMECIAGNRKALPVWLQVSVPLPRALTEESGAITAERDQGLLWYQSIGFTWRLVPERRGIYRLGPPRVIVGDLMGIYPREKILPREPLDLIVYPRLVALHPFGHIKKDLFGSPGAKSPVEDPIYLLGTREYQAGRPSRYIHWTASARLNRLQERVFEPSRQARVLYILDVTPFAAAAAGHQFERTVSGLASLALECDRQGFAVGLVTNGRITGNRSPLVAVARSGRQMTMILETLAGVEMVARQPIGEILKLIPCLSSGVSCVLFTLRRQGGEEESIDVLRRKNIAVTTVYCDAAGTPAADLADRPCLALDALVLQEAQAA